MKWFFFYELSQHLTKDFWIHQFLKNAAVKASMKHKHLFGWQIDMTTEAVKYLLQLLKVYTGLYTSIYTLKPNDVGMFSQE